MHLAGCIVKSNIIVGYNADRIENSLVERVSMRVNTEEELMQRVVYRRDGCPAPRLEKGGT